MTRTGREVARLRPEKLALTMRMTPLSTAEMILPEGETTLSVGMLAEVYDAEGSAGIFRVTEVERRAGEGSGQTARLEHALCTLEDDVMPGYVELGGKGVNTREVLERLLSRQTEKRWTLGTCEYAAEFAYSWENENLLRALLSVTQVLEGTPMWTFDQSVTPWLLNLKKAGDADGCECRQSRNLNKLKVTVNANELCTRIYPLGYGEGADQLHIGSVNGGVRYLEAASAKKWGVAAKVYAETSITEAETLKAAAQRVLEATCEPTVTVEADAAELYKLTGEATDRFRVGQKCRIPLPEWETVVEERVVEIHYADVIGAPEKAKLVLANRANGAAEALARLSRKASIGEIYSQGAASEYSVHFGDNFDPEHPAKLRFFIDKDAIHVNRVSVRFDMEPFRAYEKATAAGGRVIASDDYLAIGPTYMNGSKSVPVVDGRVTITANAIDHSHTGALRIPPHSHGIAYGIYEGEKAQKVTVEVDGVRVPAAAIENGAFDAAEYLEKENGRIRRGAWHCITFTPDGLGRMVVDVHVRTFIRSLTGANL